MSTKADHEIPLTYRKATGVVLHPPKKMEVGETVHYHSKRGEVEIYFRNRSPFGRKKEVESNDPPLELKVSGKFKALCSITTPKGVKLGYLNGKLQPSMIPGGGDMIVKGH